MNIYKFLSIIFLVCCLSLQKYDLSGQVCSMDNPTVNISLENPVLVNANEFQFDIVVTNTGTVPIKFSGLQFGLTMPSAPSGGTITASVTSPTSPPPLNVEAFSTSGPTGAITYTASTFQIRNAGTPYLAEMSAVTMPVGQPRLYKRIKVVSSTAWNQSSTTLTFNTYTQTTSYTKNKLVNYCGGNPNSNTLTDNPNAQPIPDSPLLTFSSPLFIPLPLELVDFSAEALPAFKSKLDWTTTNEVNTDYFDIERSVDGANWIQVGQVAAAGNSTSKREYNFIDRQVPVSRQKDVVVYYRLKMIDIDGKFKYSDIRGVNFNRTINDGIEIYPNPAIDMLNVDVSGMDTENGTIELSLYDASSKRVFNKTIIGSGIELLDISGLTSGTYHVRISQGQKTFNKNIIKLH